MTRSLLFWVLMILWLLFGAIIAWHPYTYQTVGGGLLQFVLFALIGWQIFGPPVKG
jgi:hypothetical protein